MDVRAPGQHRLQRAHGDEGAGLAILEQLEVRRSQVSEIPAGVVGDHRDDFEQAYFRSELGLRRARNVLACPTALSTVVPNRET